MLGGLLSGSWAETHQHDPTQLSISLPPLGGLRLVPSFLGIIWSKMYPRAEKRTRQWGVLGEMQARTILGCHCRASAKR